MSTTIQTRQFLEVSTRDKKGNKVWKRIGNREGYELNTPITKMLDEVRGSALILDTTYRAIAIIGEFKVTQPKPALEVYRTDGTFQYMGNLTQTPIPVQSESDTITQGLADYKNEKGPTGYPRWLEDEIKACMLCGSEDLCNEHCRKAERACERTALLPSVGTSLSFRYIEDSEEGEWFEGTVIKVDTKRQFVTVKTAFGDLYDVSPKTHVWRTL